MGQFLSNKYLKYKAALEGQLIDADRACPQCEYNLRGLRMGGTCPECGTPITIANPFKDALSDAPLRVIRRLCIGLWLAMASLVGLVGAPFFLSQPAVGLDFVLSGLGVIVTVLWMLGVWNITRAIEEPQGVRYRFGSRSKLRIAARVMQIPWVIVALIVFATVMSPAPVAGGKAPLDAVVRWGVPPFVVLGMAGLVVLAVLLQELAHWSYDLAAHRLLSWAIWGIPIATIGLVLPFMARPFGLFGCLFLILWMFSMISFGTAMLKLTASVTWSLVHSHERTDRDKRLRRRKKMKKAKAMLEKMEEE